MLLTWGWNRALDTAAGEAAITECTHGTCEECVVSAVASSHALVAHPFRATAETVVATIERLDNVILTSYMPGANCLLMLILSTVTFRVHESIVYQLVATMTRFGAVFTAAKLRFSSPTRSAFVPLLMEMARAVTFVATFVPVIRVVIRVEERQHW